MTEKSRDKEPDELETATSGESLLVVGRVRWPQDAAARGLSTAGWATDAASYFAVGIDAESIDGVLSMYEGDSRKVQYQPGHGLEITGVVLAPGADSSAGIRGAGFVRVDLGISPSVRIELRDRPSLVLVNEGARLGLFRPVSPLDIGPLEPVPAPPQRAIDECADQWLRERMQYHARLDDALHNAIAAGMDARLRTVTAADRGTLPKVSQSWPHAWFKELTSAQRQALTSRVIGRIHALWTDMDRIDAEMDFDSDQWHSDLVAWCLDRDDLESVRVLLNWARENGVEDVLAAFDRRAASFVRTFPVAVRINDEQLRRGAVVSPLAWWVSLLEHRDRA